VADAFRRCWRPLAALAAVTVVAAGCAGIPTRSSVLVGAPLPAVQQAQQRLVAPSGPVFADTAPQAVCGFLDAAAYPLGDGSLARQFLSTRLAHAWTPTASSFDVVSGCGGMLNAQRHEVRLAATVLARVTADGSYQSAAGPYTARFGVQHTAHGWRITSLPGTIAFPVADFALYFTSLYDVFFVGRSDRLLPDHRIVQAPTPSALGTALVRDLVAGPSRWLAPAVRTGFPTGTSLVGTVPVIGSVATVTLSRRVLSATRRQLQELAAQLVATLTQLPFVTRVRIIVDGGEPLSVPGFGRASEDRGDWPAFAPPTNTSAEYYFVSRERIRAAAVNAVGIVTHPRPSGQGAAVSTLSGPIAGLRFVAVGPGHRFAVVREVFGVEQLSAGDTARSLRPLMSADLLSPPVYDDLGELWAIRTQQGRQDVIAFAANRRPIRVESSAVTMLGELKQLAVSPDGTLAAVVVDRPSGPAVFVCRVVVVRHGLALQAPREVRGGATADPVAVSWDGPDQLVVPASGAVGAGALLVSLDGSSASLLPSGLPAAPSWIAAAAGESPVVAADGALWLDSAGQWVEQAHGSDPVYPG
jgi:hypothetical protein